VIQIGLALLRAWSFHKIELALYDVDFADDFVVPEFASGEGKIDILCEEERFAHPAIQPEDAKPVQTVGARQSWMPMSFT
jgi:hypothetical protein